MRKLFRSTSLICSAVGLALLALLAASPAHADVNDFVYDSWHVAYEVSTDDAGRAVANVTETVSPRFPETDQNRGIVRGIPIGYEGVGTDPRDFTVTDAAGKPVPFEIEDEDGYRIVLVGDDSFVHGSQTYVLSYTLSHVVLARDDGTADEFYWDVMDFEHEQPVANFSAEFVFAPELVGELDGNMRCYAGPPRSTEECALSGAGSREDPITLSGISLDAKEGVTVAVGMAPGTVPQPPQRLPHFALDGLPMIIGGGGLATGIASAVAVSRFKGRRRTGRGTVIAQYDVPADLPPLIAGPVFGDPVRDPVTAEIVHLAVIGATQLAEEVPESKKKKKKKPVQVVRVVDPSRAADPLDAAMLQALVPGAQPGLSRALPAESEEFSSAMSALEAEGKQAAVDRGYLERVRVPGARAFGYPTLVISVVLAALGVAGLMFRGSPLPLLFIVGAFITAALAIYALAKHQVYTHRGAEAREYLQGVKLFIEVAEEDRIKTLQSYSGAERREVDGVEVIHLYERLLPYAMLFNMEKEWSGVLQARYTAMPTYEPHWYPGIAMYGLAGFSESLSRYTDVVTSSVSYTSSSAGGSTGGGFAGGGGGGGFSGGR